MTWLFKNKELSRSQRNQDHSIYKYEHLSTTFTLGSCKSLRHLVTFRSAQTYFWAMLLAVFEWTGKLLLPGAICQIGKGFSYWRGAGWATMRNWLDLDQELSSGEPLTMNPPKKSQKGQVLQFWLLEATVCDFSPAAPSSSPSPPAAFGPWQLY